MEYFFLAVSILLFLSVLASKASGRLGVPALLLFLIIGMLSGSDGVGGIYFDDPFLAQSLGVAALLSILFSGGLESDWKLVKPVLKSGIVLSTVAVVFTTLLVAVFVNTILNFDFKQSLLIGAIISSTDAAAVFSILRSRGMHLKKDLKAILELESASNDPMAVFLTIGFIELLMNPSTAPVDLIGVLLLQVSVGFAIGSIMGKLMPWLINRLHLEHTGLYPVLTISSIMFTYGAATLLGGSGFLAVYLVGLIMGNHAFSHKKALIQFHDGLTWIMQIAMFLTLGLLVFPSNMMQFAEKDLWVAFFLIFIARPVSILVTLLFSKFNFREKLMISWVGLRGAVPIVLSTFPLVAGVPKADAIFNLIFFIVLTSILIQGTLIPWVAKWLRVEE